MELGNLSLELLVNILGPANKTNGGETETTGVKSGMGGSKYTGVSREAEVVVAGVGLVWFGEGWDRIRRDEDNDDEVRVDGRIERMRKGERGGRQKK